MRALLPLASAALLWIGVKTPTPLDSIRPYRSWKLVTPRPIHMEPAIAISCVGPAVWDSDAKNPHVPKIFRVFVNPKGQAVLRTMETPIRDPKTRPSFPVGTVIVKEKYAKTQTTHPDQAWPNPVALKPGAKPELLTVMVKREPGYDTPNGDWEYFAIDGAMKRVERAEVRHCQGCHRQRKSTDYVFGAYGTLTH
jgi:hypothetical protein